MSKSILKPYRRTALYYETDKMGIVHHSNYIRWFEEARIDYLRQAGLPYAEIEKMGVQIPVLSAECSYKNAVKFDETVLIKLRITAFNGFKLFVAYEVVNEQTGELHATGNTSHFFVDSSFKPVRVKKNYPEIYHVFFDYLDCSLYE